MDRLYLIYKDKIQGWCDAPLTEIGIKQAEVVAKWFDDNHIQIDDAYCKDK